MRQTEECLVKAGIDIGTLAAADPHRLLLKHYFSTEAQYVMLSTFENVIIYEMEGGTFNLKML